MESLLNINFFELILCCLLQQQEDRAGNDKKKPRFFSDLVEDLLLNKEREEGSFLVPEAQKESRKMEFIVSNFQIKVKVPGFVVESGIRKWEGSGV